MCNNSLEGTWKIKECWIHANLQQPWLIGVNYFVPLNDFLAFQKLNGHFLSSAYHELWWGIKGYPRGTNNVLCACQVNKVADFENTPRPPLQRPRRWEPPGMEAVYSKFQHLDLGSCNSMDSWTTNASFRFSNRELSEWTSSPAVHHEGWMVSGLETVFCWVHVPWLTMVVISLAFFTTYPLPIHLWGC